jgi:hypothetical protein
LGLNLPKRQIGTSVTPQYPRSRMVAAMGTPGTRVRAHHSCLGFRVYGVGFRIYGVGFRVKGEG